ncbi:MAG: GNAT family N-acetyltransferase [Actinomycetota bacterium]|nr:GNAT family N-acetyltransferase [Actinomycetota bacterium]
MLTIASYEGARHRRGIEWVLVGNGWERRYVAGQLAAIDELTTRSRPGVLGAVFVAVTGEPENPGQRAVCGFVSVEFREWNRLGQLQGLAVAPGSKRRGVASALVLNAESFVRDLSGRGLYVDTPETNEAAQGFYRAVGYGLAYTMPDYYDDGLDGVTYLKLFAR